MGLEAHVSPSGLGRCGGPIGGLIRLLMPIPMPTHRSSPRPPPRSMSNPHRRLLSNLPRPSPSGITVTIRVATTRMCSSALADGDRSPQRRHRRRTLEVPLPLFPERCWRCCTPGNSSRLAVPLDQPGSREFRIVGDVSQDVLRSLAASRPGVNVRTECCIQPPPCSMKGGLGSRTLSGAHARVGKHFANTACLIRNSIAGLWTYLTSEPRVTIGLSQSSHLTKWSI
jgi:hypothetical protein